MVFLTQSSRSPDPDHGDVWSDSMILLAARNLNQYGYSNLLYGVTFDDGPGFGLAPLYYAHWPSFPTVLLACLLKLGASTITARMAPLLATGSALVAVFLLTRRVAGSALAGIAALVALAAEAPFRLLSDSFCYMSFDFAAKAWSLFFITSACLSSGRHRRAFLVLSAIAAFATVFLFGFEMVPAVFLYGVLFPLAFGSGEGRGRLTLAARSGLAIGLGFAAGALGRLAHGAWMLGGIRPFIADLGQAFAQRSSTSLPTGPGFGAEFLDRLGLYYPVHVGVAAVAIALVVGLLARRRIERRLLVWWGIVLLGECTWFILFRRHAHVHPHTMDHLALSFCLPPALIADALGKHSSGAVRLGIGLAGAALALVALSNPFIRSRGNLQIRADWSTLKREMADLDAILPADAVVSLWVGGRDPCFEYFLRRKTLLARGGDGEAAVGQHPLFVIAARPTHERRPRHQSNANEWEKCVARYRLVRRMSVGYDVFDTRTGPGSLNEEATRGS